MFCMVNGTIIQLPEWGSVWNLLFHDITDWKRKHDLLQLTENNFNDLLQTMNDGFVSVNMDGVIIDSNPAYREITGYSSRELSHLTYRDITPRRWHQMEQTIINERILPLGYSGLYEKEYRKKDGTIVPIELHTFLLKNSDGENIGMWAIVRDLTKRKQTENTLIEREQRYRTLFDLSPGGIILEDMQGIILDVNTALCRIYGYSRTELIGKSASILFPPSPPGNFRPNREEFFDGKTQERELDTIDSQRKVHRVIFHERAIPLPDGRTGICSVVDDITTRRRMEDSIRKSEEKFSKAFKNAPLLFGIARLDTGAYVDVNDKFIAASGYSREEIIGKSSLEIGLVTEETRQIIWDALQEHGSVAGRELQIYRKDGQIVPCLYQGELIEFDGQAHILSIAIDISEQKKAEMALRESEEKFRGIFESIGTGVVYLTIAGKIIDINPALESMFNVHKQDVLGKYVQELAPQVATGKELDRILESIDKNIKGISMRSFHFTTEDQRYFEISAFHNPTKTMLTCVMTDLTEWKKAETERASLYNRQQSLLGAIPDIVMEVDKQFIYRWANEAGIQFFGTDVLGKKASAYFKGKQNTFSLLKPLLQGEQESVYVESWQKRQDGVSRLLGLWCRGLKQPDGTTRGYLSTARDITEQKEKEQALKASHEEYQRLHVALENVREEERGRLAREIHDELGQSLTAVKIELNRIKAEFNSAVILQEELAKSITLVDNVITSVRSISYELHPQILDDLGFTAAVEWYIGEFTKRTQIRCKVKADEVNFNKQTGINLFRIVQEAFTNIARHSQAQHVTVTMKRLRTSYRIIIRDDGRGIPHRTLQSQHTLGMLSMKERTKIIHGTFSISSRRHYGTTITISVPLPAEHPL